MKSDRLSEISNTYKRPTINDIQFPNMRSRGNTHQKKWKKKNDNLVEKISVQTTIEIDKAKRTYSMSLLTQRKDVKLTIVSPKKKSINPELQNISSRIKLERNQFLLLGQSPKEKNNSQDTGKKHHRRFTLLDLKLDGKKDFNWQFQSSQNEKIHFETMFPGIRLANSEVNQPQFGLLRHTQPPGIMQTTNFFEEGQSLRQTKRKPLFNGKRLSIKKHKQEYPDELVLRKLVWDGKERKKVDHQLIYQKMVGKIRTDRAQMFNGFEYKLSPRKRHEDFLTAWEDGL